MNYFTRKVMAKLDIPPPEGVFHSERPDNSDSLSRDLENHIKDILKAHGKPTVEEKIRELYHFLHKHRLDIESTCKKNGWMPEGKKDFLHSLDRSIEFSHEYITHFPKEKQKVLYGQVVESSEEVLFFLNNEFSK